MSLQIPTIKINEIISEPQITITNNIKTAMMIPLSTGEGNKPFVINTTSDLVNNVQLDEYNYKYWWQAWNYLQYNVAGCYIVRPLKLDDVNNYISLYNSTIVTNTGNQLNLYNSDVAQSLLYSEDFLGSNEKVRIYNKFVSNNDDIAIAICDNSDDWYNSSVSNENINIIRDINRFDYDNNLQLNTIYQVITKKLSNNVKKYETADNKSYLVFSDNLTFIKSGQYLRGLNTAQSVNEWFLVNDVTNNIYRQVNIENVNVGLKQITLNGYHGYLNNGDVVTVHGFSSDIFTITNITVTDTTTVLTLNKITVTSPLQSNIMVNNTLVIQSNTTVIYTETNLSTTTTTTYDIVKFLDNDWNIFLKDANIADNSFLQYNNGVWQSTTITNDKNYYVYNQQAVYHYLSNIFQKTSLVANTIDNNIANEIVYTNDMYRVNNTIISFNDLFLTVPNFEKQEIGIAVFKKDKNNNNLYTPVERYIVDFSNNSENLIYNSSKYIYYKTNKIISSNIKCNTIGKSIKSTTIINTTLNKQYQDISRYNYNELKESLYSLYDTNIYNIEYLLGFRYNVDNSLYSFDLASSFSEERGDILTIHSLYNEQDYIGKNNNTILNNLINTFGINGNNPKQFYKHGSYSAIFGNMKLQYDIYNNKNIWIPVSGDIAGIFVENSDVDISAVGYDLPIRNAIRLLFNLNDDVSRKTLNNNGINSIIYNNLKQPVIFESITCTKDLYSIVRELHKRKWSNKIKVWFKDNFFSLLLKIANNNNVSRLNDSLNSYCGTLSNFGVIKNNYNVNIINNGSNIIVNLTITFNDIIRELVFNIKLSGGQLSITESEK